MARQKVEQVQCDRCKRVELQPVGPEKTQPDFEAKLLDMHLVYEELCDRCRGALRNYWKNLQEWEREIKQGLIGPSLSGESAAPLDVAPDYSPPKPHSAAGAKR